MPRRNRMRRQSAHSRTRYDCDVRRMRVRSGMSPRKSQEIPASPGVYQIRCLQNRKIYVGSAVNLRARWIVHRRLLIMKQHHNPHLQSAWNLYGAANFEFSVLQYVEENQLLETEQTWIERTGCNNRSIGFNINSHATSGGDGVGLTWEGFRDPNGDSVTITNLHDFCRRNGLDFPSMHRLWKGQSKLKSYKGRRILPGSWPRKCAHDRCGARQDRLPSRVDARARQEKSPSFGTSGIYRSRRSTCQDHKPVSILPSLWTERGPHAPVEEWRAPKSQGLDMEA